MKIISLKSENVKRLKAVEIRPDGQNLVIVGGKNSQGKSSVLDSILYALAGGNALPAVPIRHGQDQASIVVEFGDLIVKRTFNGSGTSYLKVENKEGAQFKSPQAMLDKLTGALTFDPLEFSRMDPKKQVAILKGLVGIDFNELDKQRAEIFNERTLANRQVKEMEALVANSPTHLDAPDEEVSVEALVNEQERMEKIVAENKAQRDLLEVKRSDVVNLKANKDRLNSEITELQRKLKEVQEELQTVSYQIEAKTNEGKDFAEKVTALVDPDLNAVREKIKNAGAINAKVRDNKVAKVHLDKLNDAKAEMDNLSYAISEIDQLKEDQLTKAKFPIPGMSFDENGVLLNGLPFSQASSSEQLRVSVAMGLALNPSLKVLLVRDGSLLDEDSLRMMAEIAAEAKAQVWIERVSEGEEVSLIIEDGMVKVSPVRVVNE